MNADGTDQRRLSEGCCFDWSPDGRKIAFASDGIYVINVDGTGLRLLVKSEARLCCDLDWSPDGRRIAFTGWRGGIHVTRADGAGTTRLTAGYDSSPRWSPDGRRILFTRHISGGIGNDFFVVNADGSMLRMLTRNFYRPAAEAPSWSPWSPDSRRIAVAGGTGGYDGNEEIFVMNADGSDQRNITRTSGVNEDAPTWSPTGIGIAFTSTRKFRRVSAIHTIRSDGHKHRSLTQGNHPSWSEDGRHIVFMRARGSKSDIFVMTVRGRNPVALTTAPEPEFSPSWSPAP
jgi:Tol biopolymer transport system component